MHAKKTKLLFDNYVLIMLFLVRLIGMEICCNAQSFVDSVDCFSLRK
jgi:hypothetical protein